MTEPRVSGRPPETPGAPDERRASSRLRFPKARHLRKRRDFVRVQDRSARVTTAHFVLLVAPRPRHPAPVRASDSRSPGEASRASGPVRNPELAPDRSPAIGAALPAQVPCRLGIVASKKVGCAVVRNRTKRLVREAFRTRPELFPRDVDLVIIARQGPRDLSLDIVCREIEGVAHLLARRARDAVRAASGDRPRVPSSGK